jgi:hypothetical protein
MASAPAFWPALSRPVDPPIDTHTQRSPAVTRCRDAGPRMMCSCCSLRRLRAVFTGLYGPRRPGMPSAMTAFILLTTSSASLAPHMRQCRPDGCASSARSRGEVIPHAVQWIIMACSPSFSSQLVRRLTSETAYAARAPPIGRPAHGAPFTFDHSPDAPLLQPAGHCDSRHQCERHIFASQRTLRYERRIESAVPLTLKVLLWLFEFVCCTVCQAH